MRRYVIAAAFAVPLTLVLFVAGIYAYDEIITDDQVSHGVIVDGIDISRMTPNRAIDTIVAHENRMASDPIEVVVDGHTLTLLPSDIGFDIDEHGIVNEALRTRRSSNGFANFASWIGTRFGTVQLTTEPTIDEEAVRAILAEWNTTAIDKPAHDGGVLIVDGVPTAEYPQAGTRIDADA